MEAMAITLIILAIAFCTYLFRVVPLAVLSRFDLPVWAQDWLELVPGAVLAATLAQILLVRDGTLSVSLDNLYLLAALPTALVAWKTRNLVPTMLVGIAAYALLSHWLA